MKEEGEDDGLEEEERVEGVRVGVECGRSGHRQTMPLLK